MRGHAILRYARRLLSFAIVGAVAMTSAGLAIGFGAIAPIRPSQIPRKCRSREKAKNRRLLRRCRAQTS
jgi:hypothetical protein